MQLKWQLSRRPEGRKIKVEHRVVFLTVGVNHSSELWNRSEATLLIFLEILFQPLFVFVVCFLLFFVSDVVVIVVL